MYADSIWRGGEDTDFAGVGTDRERWITYRDGDTYDEVVKAGWLYPLNSLMLHGIVYAKQAPHLATDPGGDFANEVHSYFGSGTQLQELYITPSLLTAANWETLAEAAKWSRANASVLVDTHWVGGDPRWLEVYGWAAWSPAKAILTLRNPSDHAQDFTVDIASAFELPPGAARSYSARSPWAADASQAAIELRAGEGHTFHLAPFQVLTLEAVANELPMNFSSIVCTPAVRFRWQVRPSERHAERLCRTVRSSIILSVIAVLPHRSAGRPSWKPYLSTLTASALARSLSADHLIYIGGQFCRAGLAMYESPQLQPRFSRIAPSRMSQAIRGQHSAGSNAYVRWTCCIRSGRA